MEMRVVLIVQLAFIAVIALQVESLTFNSLFQDYSSTVDAGNPENDAEDVDDLYPEYENSTESTGTLEPHTDSAFTNLEDIDDEEADSKQSRRRRRHRRRHHASTDSGSDESTQEDPTSTTPKSDTDTSTTSQGNPEEVFKSENGQETLHDTTGKLINNDFPVKTAKDIASKEYVTKNKYVSSACPKCTRVEQEQQLRFDEVKMTILTRLGLSAVPKIDGQIHPLPSDFYAKEDFMNDQTHEDDEVDEHSVRTKEIFIFGKDITEKCVHKKGTGCYSFNLTSQNIDSQAVASVELWVYKQADLHDHYIQTFMASELGQHLMTKDGETLQSRNILKRVETKLKYGWIKFYVKRTVLRWLSKPNRNHGLAVTCQTCKRQSHRTIYGDKEGLMPILVFYMKDKPPRRRQKRSVNCIEGGNNCCHKVALEIVFSEIGWDYIMAPLSIRPNYCIGSCNGIGAAHYNHTRLAQTLKQTIAYNHLNLQPCCSPVSFRHPQSLIYRDNNNVVRKVDVPDLIVGECGCA